MALKRRAPIYLVRFMLKVNPEAASIPKQGPSPLQIALQSSCTVDVVKALVDVCPFALVVTNPGSYLDPLSYAKRFRPSETELIRLLSLPFNHWIELNEQGAGSCIQNQEDVSSSGDSISSKNLPQLVPSSLTRNHLGASKLASSDPTELNNIKLICLSVLKGHKRPTREMLDVQRQVNKIESTVSSAVKSVATTTRRQLQATDIKEIVQIAKIREQQKIAQTQLIALEMKEQAMRSSVRQMERRVMLSVQSIRDETMANVKIRLNAIVGSLQVRLQNFTDRMHRMESLARGSLVTDRGNPVGQEIRAIANHRQQEKKKSLVIVGMNSQAASRAASPSSYTYRSDHTLETLEESDQGSLPIIYASPFKKIRGGDNDTRSLLTGETFVDRPSHYRYRRPRRVLAAGKRVLLLLCKH